MNLSTEIRERIEVSLKGEAAAIVQDLERVEMIVPPDLAATASATGASVVAGASDGRWISCGSFWPMRCATGRFGWVELGAY